MLDAEARFHAEGGALFDREGLVLEVLDRTWLVEVDDDVRTAFDFETEREDHDAALVAWVADGRAAADA